MPSAFWVALAFSLAAATVTCLGIITIRRFADWGRRNATYFMSFAAGVLLAASFLHIIPRAFSMNQNASVYIAIGFFGLLLFNRFITASVCEKNHEKAEYAIGVIPMLGIGFHSFIDGVVYSIAFSVGIFTGFMATAGMVLHEFPEGIVTYVLLVRGGVSERASLVLAVVAAAATTPVGMLLSYPLISRIDEAALGAMLALSAGALIYVGATHLLPKAEQDHKRYSLAALCGGVLVAVAIALSGP